MNRAAALFLTAFCFCTLHASTPNPYPREIKNLKFYARYIAPLRPAHSDANDVVKVFGVAQRLERNAWTFEVLYSCKDDPVTCSHGPRNDRVAQIVVTPKHRVSLTHQRFPGAFAHGYGTISEINITCDVYKDGTGLEYWVVSKDFPHYKKGDLVQILYGSVVP